VYYEQRGSGRSEAALDKDSYTVAQLIADLEALRLALNLGRINLFGFSFGAELALEYAAAHPNAVHHVIATAPGSIFGSRVEAVQLNNRLEPVQVFSRTPRKGQHDGRMDATFIP
jgi:proline iminopeptidase